MQLLKVDRAQFFEAVRLTTGTIRRKRQAKAVFTFADGTLRIQVANNVTEVSAQGEWPGTAKVGAIFLFKVVSPPPEGDPITLRVDDKRLYVERISTPCEWIPRSGRAG